MYDEDDFIPLSGIQHFMFCRRQWALIHIEQQWKDNALTIEGNILHERAHQVNTEVRDGVVITRELSVFSRELGVRGVCDVVEWHPDPAGTPINARKGTFSPIPIEYKRGKPKEHNADEMQLCAQAMCLEEMLAYPVPKGYLFYGEPRRRTEVIFDNAMRAEVRSSFAEMHEYLRRGYTPNSKPAKVCRSCSLFDVCLPRLPGKRSAADYVRTRLAEDDA